MTDQNSEDSSGAAAMAKWITVWASATQGPYPIGTDDQQRRLHRAFPPHCRDAGDLTVRVIVKPAFLTSVLRLRFSNIMSPRPLTLGDVRVGLQDRGAALVHNTTRAVLFGGREIAIIPPRERLWSDPVELELGDASATSPLLAVSFHLPRNFGQIDWLSEAFVTSYVSRAGSGTIASDETGFGLSETTTGRFLLDAIEVMTHDTIKVIAAFGDSITNGTGSTIDGFDRWTDILSLRLRRVYPNRFAVVNLGIGGNQVLEARNDAASPSAGGPPAIERWEREILGLSGLAAVIWMQGINDLAAGAQADAVFAAMITAAQRMRSVLPNITLIGGTLTPCLGSEGNYGLPEVDAERRRLNALIRKADIFDSIIDFEGSVIDPNTGGFLPGFANGDVMAASGDRFHPSRAGHLAMGTCIDLRAIAAI